MTFILTPDTDPSTVMFEGMPDTIIEKIMPRMPAACTAPGQVYVCTDAASRSYNADGTRAEDCSQTFNARIVPRVAFDPAKPVIATTNTGETRRYRVTGIFTPVDPAGEPVIHVSPIDHPTAVDLEIYASTGKVTPGMGQNGIALKFSNGPFVEKKNVLANLGGHLTSLTLTLTDGELTNVEWIK